MQATVGTRELAQGAASELSASVDELVKGAEKGITRSGRSVRAAVEERLPATQDDVKALRTELRRLGKRLEAIEEQLAAGSTRRTTTKPAAKTKPKPAATAKAGPKRGTGAKPAAKAKPRSAARTKPKR